MIGPLVNSVLISPERSLHLHSWGASLLTHSVLFLLGHHSLVLFLLLCLFFLRLILSFSIILDTTIWWCSSGILVLFLINIIASVKSSSLMVLYIVCPLLTLKCLRLTCALIPDFHIHPPHHDQNQTLKSHPTTYSSKVFTISSCHLYSSVVQAKNLGAILDSILPLTPHIKSTSHCLHLVF